MTDEQGAASFLTYIQQAIEYVKQAGSFIGDIYNCLPPNAQTFVTMMFILVFGFATVYALFSILK